MDIEGPQPDEEVAREPRRAAQQNVDTVQLVRDTIEQHPSLEPDEVVALLAEGGIQVSGVMVAAEKLKK